MKPESYHYENMSRAALVRLLKAKDYQLHQATLKLRECEKREVARGRIVAKLGG